MVQRQLGMHGPLLTPRHEPSLATRPAEAGARARARGRASRSTARGFALALGFAAFGEQPVHVGDVVASSAAEGRIAKGESAHNPIAAQAATLHAIEALLP